MSGAVIRKASADDCSYVYEIALRNEFQSVSSQARQCFGFLFPYSENEYKAFSRTADFFFVATISDIPIGFVLAQGIQYFTPNEMEVYVYLMQHEPGTSLVVRQICIDPTYGHCGYGGALYDCLFDELKHSIYKEAVTFIWTKPDNRPSELFHEKTGWRKTEIYALRKALSFDRREVGVWHRTI